MYGELCVEKIVFDNREDVAFFVDMIKLVEKNFYMDDFLKFVCDKVIVVRMFREMIFWYAEVLD